MALIRGRVVDAAGRPVAGARVMVDAAPVAMPDIALLSGEDGGFVLAAPAPGAYRLRAVTDASGEALGAVEVGPGDAMIELRLN